VEEVEAPSGDRGSRAVAPPSVTGLAEVDADATVPAPTGVDEVDRVLGGGLVAGGVSLLGGEPGIGKSTLTLQLSAAVAGQGGAVLVVAGEEAPAQIASRARRLGPVPASLSVIDDVSVDVIVAAIRQVRPQLVVVDSIQTVRVDDVDGAPGSVGQLRAATQRLATAAKSARASMILVGHLTKDGALAGPKTIEHLVDTVLVFSGDRSGELRYLRPVKHRYGSTTELGLFDMAPDGLRAVSDPSGRFLTDRQVGLPGSVVVPTLEGRRPILVEVQALTVDVAPLGGSVTVQGIDRRRLAMVSAVLGRRAGRPLARNDVFVSATGGAVVTEPGADLAVAVALSSSLTDRPVAPDVVACGEIGLGGEIRSVPQLDIRLQEAYRLGFRTAVVPASAPPGPTGMRLVRSATLSDALTGCWRRAR
jgi:DNA repair protein RadA/Sms